MELGYVGLGYVGLGYVGLGYVGLVNDFAVDWLYVSLR